MVSVCWRVPIAEGASASPTYIVALALIKPWLFCSYKMLNMHSREYTPRIVHLLSSEVITATLFMKTVTSNSNS